ncbi:MAG: hypothetical protein JSV58_00895 [Candidatus Bathyarchaeota archaeon]|nr:MAG: hypothetical protein JSV58_00895 [Candidatus Bathyarchaeota archaeon]
MENQEIRLKYSGLILFGSRLLSVITGLAFILMITRSVSVEEFGIWGNLNDVLSYFILLANVIPFWTTRFVARTHSGAAGTGLIANLFVSFGSTTIYLALFSTILSTLQISANYAPLYGIAAIQIVELHMVSALEAVLHARQPQAIGYGLLLNEGIKVILGFILISQFKLGLLGALIAIAGSHLIQIAFYIGIVAKELREGVRWTYLREWIKASLINIYNIIGSRIAAMPLILLFIHSELARSYYGAAFTIANVVTYSTFLSYALYPRLLSKSNSQDVSTSLKMVLMPAIPMTIGVIVLSDSYLTILRQEYLEARLVLIILAIWVFSEALLQVFRVVALGTEKIDVKAKIPFRQLPRTKLFQIFTIPYIQSAITLPATFIMLSFADDSSLVAATYLAMINLIVGLAMLVVTYRISRRCLTFHFPWRSIEKYLLASTVMAMILILAPHPSRITSTLILTGVGGIAYFIVLALFDVDTRELMKSILGETKARLSQEKQGKS